MSLLRRLILPLLLTVAATAALAAPLREMRGAWIVTSLGLDWPRGHHDPAEQRRLMADMLDRLALANFNTVFVEMQSQGDVLWQSLHQPAAADVTGQPSMGLPYDVARTFIDEAHKRGLDIYAIVNPLDLGTMGNALRYSDQRIKHPLLASPELAVAHDGHYYLDPSNGYALDYLVDLYTELVSGYPFDGILIDAPMYPSAGHDEALTEVVTDLRRVIDTYRPGTRLALAADALTPYDDAGSRPSMPAVRELIDEGVVDLMVPKLFARAGRGFAPALDDWTNTTYSRSTVMAITPEMLEDVHHTAAPELASQIELTHQADDSIAGVVIYRVSMLTDPYRPGALERYRSIRDEAFVIPAHQPLLPGQPATEPNPPGRVEVSTPSEGTYVISWEAPEPDALDTPIRYYSIYVAREGEADLTDPRGVVAHRVDGNSYTLLSPQPGLEFAVTAFDANYRESLPSFSPASAADGLQDRPYLFRYYADQLYISGPKPLERVDIYSTWGSHARSLKTSGYETSLECSYLPAGVYVVRTHYSDGSTRVNKFVK